MQAEQREHDLDAEDSCWCRPEVEVQINGAKVIIHNDRDPRESVMADKWTWESRYGQFYKDGKLVTPYVAAEAINQLEADLQSARTALKDRSVQWVTLFLQSLIAGFEEGRLHFEDLSTEGQDDLRRLVRFAATGRVR